ncbi:MAG TPA: D-alanyl-D-alanine carboxypeptidase/D-alanyl-D-alanine-endopeptidase, partial [Candidatus Polarisedimenticolia bacterium]|nr:D-alanyl-D-alanine carboxypeptidase/D-alanyl-D-alanine-endopeptidase [Candidatus Polarisedimenticolia bacterium]
MMSLPRHLPRLFIVAILGGTPAFATASMSGSAAAAAPPAPATTATAASDQKATVAPFAATLGGLVTSSAVLHPQETGIVVMALPERRVVYARQGDRPLKPASTLKILTTAASLALLRPEFVPTTPIYADADIDTSGVLSGNLYLQGRGAPDLVGESFWLIARRLADLGLKKVAGNLVADESYFDTVRRPPGWPAPTADSWYNAPQGALSCNFNVVTVRVAPSPLLGSRPDLTLEPASSYFQVLNRATTAAQATDLRVDRLYEEGQNRLVVGGSVRRGGGTEIVNRSVEEPALWSLTAFKEIARGLGIEVAGKLEIGTVPAGARLLYTHDSKPLGSLVRDMNKNSNNFMAEMLLKTLGAQFVQTPGTTEGGLEMVRAYLAGLGLDPADMRIVDGSGLSDNDRMPAMMMAEILARASADFEVGPELVSSLPIGGADGTLADRFASEEGRRRVRAKTGRVAGAISLAGYASNRDGHMLAFAIFANQPRGTLDAVHRSLDRLV